MGIRCPECSVENADYAAYCVWCKSKIGFQESEDLYLDDVDNQEPKIQEPEIQNHATVKKPKAADDFMSKKFYPINVDSKKENLRKLKPTKEVKKDKTFLVRLKDISYVIVSILIIAAVFTIWLETNKTGASKRFGLFERNKLKILRLFRQTIFSKQRFNNFNFIKHNKIYGIFYSKDNSYVLIGNKIYYPNDSVYGGRIIDISQDEVKIQFQEREGVYRVGYVIKKESPSTSSVIEKDAI